MKNDELAHWIDTRHKLFISYYHAEDQLYRDLFESWYKHLFTNKSVGAGEIDSHLSARYIKRLIPEGKITDSSVLVVLVGPNTSMSFHKYLYIKSS